MSNILAFKGEFGLKVLYHVPWVYAKGPGHIIEIEPGEEALYPLAREWKVTKRAHDDTRTRGPGKLKPLERFIPEPHVRQNLPAADIVVCPRQRSYGASKNWPRWPELTEALRHAGFSVFAAGAPDSSAEVDCPRAWDYPRFLDASIEAMRQARLVVATDAGLAHLAVLCGAPLLIITYQGRVAPGHCITSHGRDCGPYWPVRFDEYYRSANHTGAPLEMVDGWEHPERVIEAAVRMTEAMACS